MEAPSHPSKYGRCGLTFSGQTVVEENNADGGISWRALARHSFRVIRTPDKREIAKGAAMAKEALEARSD
jgi:hypothetical protein